MEGCRPLALQVRRDFAEPLVEIPLSRWIQLLVYTNGECGDRRDYARLTENYPPDSLYLTIFVERTEKDNSERCHPQQARGKVYDADTVLNHRDPQFSCLVGFLGAARLSILC